MPKRIQDEFTNLPSEMARYLARKKARGLCLRCKEPAMDGYVSCEKHNEEQRLRSAARMAFKKVQQGGANEKSS